MNENFPWSKLHVKIIPLYKICFLLIIFTFVGFTLSYSLLTPTFEGPDEDAHYRYSIWLFNPELRPDPNYHLYTNVAQPLYYVVNSIFFNLLDPDDQYVNGLNVTNDYPIEDKNRFQHGPEEIFPYSDIAATIHTLRLLSIAFGVITLIFVYKIAQLVFPTNRWLPLYTTAFVSLIPMFLSINAVLNSDVLVWTLSTIALFFLLKFVNEPHRIRFIILVAVFSTMALTTKTNGMVLIPIFLSVIAYLFISKQIKIQSLVKHISLFALFSVFSILWLWVFRALRNIDYNNPTISEILYAAFGFARGNLASVAPIGLLNPSTAYQFSFSRLYDVEFLLSRFVNSAFNGFWWHTISISNDYYIILYIFLIVSLVGLVIFLIRRQNIMTELNMKKNHLLVLSTAILLSIGYLYINFLQTEIGVARYYFPIISMLGIVIPLGWYAFVYNKKNLRFIMLCPLVFLIFINIQILIVMGEEQNINLSQDDDFDGISNLLDVYPDKFSNDFNDKYFGGNTFGNIVVHPNQPFSVFYELKYNGISISSSPSSKINDLEIIVCDETISFSSGDLLTFSCKEEKLNIIKHIKFLDDLPLDLKDGDLIQGESKNEVYLVQNKMKRHITNIDVFEELGFNVTTIKIIPNEIIEQIRHGLNISGPNDI